MGDPVFFSTPAGEEFALLTKADYQRLVDQAEAADDVALYDRAIKRLAERPADRLPFALVEQLVAGENPVRVWREHRGLKGTALAAKAGIAPAYLSQIERGTRDGTFLTMSKIAAALDVELEDLNWSRPGT